MKDYGIIKRKNTDLITSVEALYQKLQGTEFVEFYGPFEEYLKKSINFEPKSEF